MKTTSTLVLALAMGVLLGSLLCDLSLANPYAYAGEVPPKPDTVPPKITFYSPINNKRYNTTDIILTFNVSTPMGHTVYAATAEEIYYTADWQQGSVGLYAVRGMYRYRPLYEYSANLSLMGVPEGNHSITVFAKYRGWYIPGNNNHTQSKNDFYMNGSSTINFTIDDQIAPKIYAISLGGKTYYSTDVPLTFRTNEQSMEFTYSLDGRMNVSIVGDTVLTGLSYGTHNLTAYATDPAGNKSPPITVTFNVVDNIPPKISILSPENKTYDSSAVPLNFTVNEAVSKLTYVLDGRENVTFAGNTTLTGLANGQHNVTVYATDYGGNNGFSKTIDFSVEVPESFPIVPFVVASIVVAAVMAASVLVYYKMRGRG